MRQERRINHRHQRENRVRDAPATLKDQVACSKCFSKSMPPPPSSPTLTITIALLLLNTLLITGSDQQAPQSPADSKQVQRDACDDAFDQDYQGVGKDDICCPMWRRANCKVKQVNADVAYARDLVIGQERMRMQGAGCTRFVDNVGGNMPVPCYWRYRRLLLVLIGTTASLAIAVPLIMCLTKRCRSS